MLNEEYKFVDKVILPALGLQDKSLNINVNLCELHCMKRLLFLHFSGM